MIKETELAYLAGLLDGEGTISLTSKLRKYGYRYFQPRICITNTKIEMLNFCKDKFGGLIYISAKANSVENRRTAYRWSLSGDKACLLLASILPFLTIKKQQAQLVLVFQGTGIKNTKKEADGIVISKFKSRLANLNSRGLAQG